MGISEENTANSTISSQVITASLTMITVVGVFAVFIIEKRDIDIWYYLIAGCAFFCFVISIFLGGKGLSGKGKQKQPNPYFNWQAITALSGVVLFCISVFLGKEKPDNIIKIINEQEKIVIELKIKDDYRTKEIEKLKEDINKLTIQLDETKKLLCPTSRQPCNAGCSRK